ncbi:hypothetical protein F4775DRAFT_513091 [Biscogniauxia sp. FL1348]|nr:hypothetical protein F4775DRAFT_513091 [Biscogniauxia sp. FL1348]
MFFFPYLFSPLPLTFFFSSLSFSFSPLPFISLIFRRERNKKKWGGDRENKKKKREPSDIQRSDDNKPFLLRTYTSHPSPFIHPP